MTCPHCRAQNADGAAVCASCRQPLAAPPVLGPGSVVLDRYEIVRQLGQGGMAIVFEAHDRALDLRVAIKVVRGPDLDAESLSRLRSEVKLARKVRHRHVGGIYDYGEDGDLEFISMELVEGQDLRHLVHERGPLDWEPAYAVALQVGEGLEAIHEAGIIHRDLKPANIMIDSSGGVRVMDFGIAKPGSATESSHTQTGQVVGTPEYMSPEQVRGREIDFRSDLYAFGVVVFEIFTGRAPFHAPTPVGTMLLHLEEPPPLEPPPPRLPSALVSVLRRALAKDPRDRFSSCAEMLSALRSAREALAADRTDAVALPEEEVASGERPTELARRRSPTPTLPDEARLLVPMLTQALRNPQREVRLGAARALVLHGPAAAQAIPNLEVLLTDPVTEVRDLAMLALRVIAPETGGTPAVRPPLLSRPTPAQGPSPIAPSRAGPLTSGSDLPPRSLETSPPAVQPEEAPAAATDPRLHATGPADPQPPPLADTPKVAAWVTPPRGVEASPSVPSPQPPVSRLPSPRPHAFPREQTPLRPLPPSRPPWQWLAAIGTLLAVLAIAWLAASGRSHGFGPTATSTSTSTSATTSTSTTTTSTMPPPSPPPSRVPRESVAAIRPTTTTTTSTTTSTTTTTLPPPPPSTTTTTSSTTTTTLPVLEPPVCLKCPQPEYSLIASQAAVRGTVRLRLLVDENGRVADVQVVQPVKLLTEIAVKTARAQVYRPARRGGVAEKAWVVMDFEFK